MSGGAGCGREEAGMRAVGVEAWRKVVETWMGGAMSGVGLRWESACRARVEGARGVGEEGGRGGGRGSVVASRVAIEWFGRGVSWFDMVCCASCCYCF